MIARQCINFFAQSIVSCVRGDGPTMNTPPRRTPADVEFTPRKKKKPRSRSGSRSRSRSPGYWERLNASLAHQQRVRHAEERRGMLEHQRRLEAEGNWMLAREYADFLRGFAVQ